MSLAVVVYGVAKQLPATERFELAAQMRRAAVSVPSNVAEEQANGPGGRYRHHVRIALGSWAELVTHVELVKSLRLLAPEFLAEFEA
jgi:four helix bundle protein